MHLMNRLEISYFADFFLRIFKNKEKYSFLLNPPVEGTVNSMAQSGKRLESFVKLMSRIPSLDGSIEPKSKRIHADY